MPELKNCRRCNRVFSYVGGLPICPACAKEDERLFEKVSMYIRENPGVPLNVVSEELDISFEKLMKYVREGRLQVRAPNGGFVMFCENCGAMIEKGKLCIECDRHINNVLDTSQRTLQRKLNAIEAKQAMYRYRSAEPPKKK